MGKNYEYHDRTSRVLSKFLHTLVKVLDIDAWEVRMEDYYRLDRNLKQNRISNEEKDFV